MYKRKTHTFPFSERCAFYFGIDEKTGRLYNKQKAVIILGQIKTYTGIMFDPTQPEKKYINIRDIAHALSMLCRANGHFKSFYSVGQHCINCAKEAAARGLSVRVQLGCLLHDGSEAYVSDITRPVKQVLPKYLEIEEPLQQTVWDKWLTPALTPEETRQVFEIDDDMLLHEFLVLMDTALSDNIPPLHALAQFDFVGFEATEEEYIQLFQTLCEKL